MDDSPFAIEKEVETCLSQETAAYEKMHDQLMAQFAGEFVAVFKGRLIDHDVDSSALLNRIDAAYPNDVVLVKRVVALPEPEIRVRSPRLERL